MEAYRSALHGEKQPEKPAHESDSLSATILAYRHSGEWRGLAEATRRQRGNMLDRVSAKVGHVAVMGIDRAMIVAGRNELKPGAAKCLIDTLRGLFKWAKANGHVTDDPTEGIKVPDIKTEGFHTWSEAEIAAYRAHWPIGSRERLWLEILLNTGLRREDAARLSDQHVTKGVAEIVTQKRKMLVTLPLHRDLKHALAKTKLGKRSFVGMQGASFSRAFRKACDEAGVKGSAHGLRKAAATRLAEAGASVPELNAVFGWTGAKMALKYTEKADRVRLARQGMERAAMFSPSER